MSHAEFILAETMAASLLEAVALPQQPSVDVFEVARRLGVDAIEIVAIPEDGRLELRNGRARIVLAAGAPPTRRRFTLAHELAHLLLDDTGVALAVGRVVPHVLDVERFCNTFAAELLMPSGWVRHKFGKAPEAFETLDSLTRQAYVSRTAAFVQLARHASWSPALLFFDRERSWTPMTLAGAPPSARGALNAFGDTSSVVAEIHSRKLCGLSRIIQLQAREQLLNVRAQFEPTSRGVLALVFLRSAEPVNGAPCAAPPELAVRRPSAVSQPGCWPKA